MRTRRTWPAIAVGLVLATGGLSSCGGNDEGAATNEGEEAGKVTFESASAQAADQTVCVADAVAIQAPYGDNFPGEWIFPSDTVVYDYEDRGATGVIVTAVSSAPFEEILAFLNGDEQDAGFTVTDGETEENDAEASWTSTDYAGRWAIQKSGTCEGETVIQVLATAAE